MSLFMFYLLDGIPSFSAGDFCRSFFGQIIIFTLYIKLGCLTHSSRLLVKKEYQKVFVDGHPKSSV